MKIYSKRVFHYVKVNGRKEDKVVSPYRNYYLDLLGMYDTRIKYDEKNFIFCGLDV